MPMPMGSKTKLNQTQGGVPVMTAALNNWVQKITFIRVIKENVAGILSETEEPVSFEGVIQPLKDRDLSILPEGQRSWTWYWLHCDPSIILNTDEIVTYQGVKTRIMGRKDYKLYGYVEYRLCQNWSTTS